MPSTWKPSALRRSFISLVLVAVPALAGAQGWRSPLADRELVVIEKGPVGDATPASRALPPAVAALLGPDFVEYEAFVAARLLEERGRMAVELRVSWDEHGKLTTAEAKTYGLCGSTPQAGCTNLQQRSLLWFLIPPVYGGREYYSNDRLQYGGAFRWTQGPDAPKTINFTPLLAGTTWNRPIW